MDFHVPEYPKGIRSYYIGLGVLGALTVILFLIILVMGVNSRQDVVTAQKASEIVTALNSYASDHSQAPASLAVLKVKNIPSSITYKKINATSYKFCAFYRASDSSFSTTGIQDGLNQFESGLNSSGTGLATDTSGSTTYFTTSTHHKGQNCQTITIYGDPGSANQGLHSSPGLNSGSGNSGYDGSTDPCVYPTNDTSDAAYQKYVDCENNYLNSTTPGTNTTTPARGAPTTKT